MKQIFILTTLALTFWNCSSTGEKKLSRVEQCKAIFSDADELMQEQSYYSAREPLLEVQNTCSGTGFMETSQLLLAQSYFLSEEWMEARAEYALFVEQYPSSPHSPLSSYNKAVSAYNVDYVPGRDNSFTQKALRDFDAFLSNYPENVKNDSAKIFKKELLERLAEEQLAIAVLYSRMSEPQASAIYLKEMLNTYPNSRKIFDALVLLCEMYIRLDQFEQAQEFITQLQNRFPVRAAKVASSLNSDLSNAQENFNDNIENKKDKKMRKSKKVNKS
jgi:outer membrane protein assembly factor BamD